MARVSLTSCPLIRRQREGKAPRPCGIGARVKDGANTDRLLVHTHVTVKLWYQPPHTHQKSRRSANRLPDNCRSLVPFCLVVPTFIGLQNILSEVSGKCVAEQLLFIALLSEWHLLTK